MADAINPVAASPALIIADLLIAQTLSDIATESGTTKWPTFVDFNVDSASVPPNVISCITTTPVPDGFLQFNGRQVMDCGVQLIAQTTSSFNSAYAKLGEIADELPRLTQLTLTISDIPYLIHTIRVASGPLRMGKSEAGRWKCSLNLLMSVTTDKP